MGRGLRTRTACTDQKDRRKRKRQGIGEESLTSRSQGPPWERDAPKLCFACRRLTGDAVPARTLPDEAELRGLAFPSRTWERGRGAPPPPSASLLDPFDPCTQSVSEVRVPF